MNPAHRINRNILLTLYQSGADGKGSITWALLVLLDYARFGKSLCHLATRGWNALERLHPERWKCMNHIVKCDSEKCYSLRIRAPTLRARKASYMPSKNWGFNCNLECPQINNNKKIDWKINSLFSQQWEYASFALMANQPRDVVERLHPEKKGGKCEN